MSEAGCGRLHPDSQSAITEVLIACKWESMVTRLTALEEEIGWMVHASYNFADEEISEGCGVRASRWRFAVVIMRNLRNES